MRGLVVACAMLLAWPARAQLDVEAAKAHFAAGSADFEAGRYADALGEFEKAYKLSGRAPLLYNIGLCHERLGHRAQAIQAYERYVSTLEPDSPDRPGVEARLAELRAPPKPSTPAVRPDLVTTQTARERRPLHKRAWFWGVVGGAAVVVVVGVTVGVVVGTRDSTRVLPDVRPQ